MIGLAPVEQADSSAASKMAENRDRAVKCMGMWINLETGAISENINKKSLARHQGFFYRLTK